MEIANFEALPLHDAVLRLIEVNWESKQCRLRLTAFTTPSSVAQPCVLTFDGVTFLSMPHNEPWGPSSSVNTASIANGRFRIEMQSGDAIELSATGFAFSAL